MSDWDLIYCYSRKEAISDGVLIDYTKMAKEAGFKIPVAITNRVWHELIVPKDELQKIGQSTDGRLWDTLFMCHVAIHNNKGNNNQLNFQVFYLKDMAKNPELIELKAIIGLGDTGEPVFTIMYPYED